jgi:ferric-dicitrate binding protein FerR (iron transport regulator)
LTDSNNHIENLFLKFLDGSGSEDEILQLRNWISDNSNNKEEFVRLYNIYVASGASSYEPDKAWENLKNKLIEKPVKTVKFSLSVFIKVAAAILLILVTGLLIYKVLNKQWEKKLILSEFSVPRGSRSHVYLPDGTSVWLNAQTTLKYYQNFGQNKREVILEGEAFFEVVRDENVPFIVKTSDAEVKVLGTKFNVKAYPEEKYIETTVVNGKVQVSSPQISVKGQDKIYLIANQKVKILKEVAVKEEQNLQNKADSLKITNGLEDEEPVFVEFTPKVSSQNYISWKDSLWVIEREHLKDLAVKMERRFDVEIDFKDKGLEEYVFSGKLKDESLEQVLEALSAASPIDYQINQKRITFFNKHKP